VLCMVVSTQALSDSEEFDYSQADSPNKRTALEYIYLANNQGKFQEARKRYYDPVALQADEQRREARFKAIAELQSKSPMAAGKNLPPPPSPKFTVKRVVEEGNQVVVLAFVQGVGIGRELTTLWGTSGGVKIGDAVVEIFEFNDQGKILQKWDVIEELSQISYDF